MELKQATKELTLIQAMLGMAGFASPRMPSIRELKKPDPVIQAAAEAKRARKNAKRLKNGL